MTALLHRQLPGGREPTAEPIGAEDPDRTDPWRVLETWVCGFCLVLLGWRGVFHYQTSYGAVVGLAMLPVWVGAARRFRGASVFALAGIAAMASGILLAVLAPSRGRSVALNQFLTDSGLLLVTIITVGVLLWARTIMTRRTVAICYGVGLLVRLVGTGLGTDNPWKFAFAVPVAVLLLAVADHLRNRLWTLVALGALGLVSAFQDSRSLFATFLLAGILVTWQLRPTKMGKPASWVWTVLLGAALAAAIYNLATALLVDGYFGETARRRTLTQIQSAGSLILGGRPEIAATRALMGHNPLGFGFGVGPNVFDVGLAKAGMRRINYNPDNNYVEEYMLGGHVELHSTVGDLWARAGLMGLALALLVGFLVARNLADSMHRREASGLVAFLTCYTGWNLFFSPQSSALPTLCLTLGLAMIALPSVAAPGGSPIEGTAPPPDRVLTPRASLPAPQGSTH